MTTEKKSMNETAQTNKLEDLVQSTRGHHKIILGCAPGVGKTYRMLQEGHVLKKYGVDIIVGYFEPHDRKETIALLEGLESIPPKNVNYKGIILPEMDTETIIKRHPRIALVDELAHTNVPGNKYQKRYEDVNEILANGINVISTMNIQHIESLYDLINQTTGIPVYERVPDIVINQANELVVVDISIEELQDRLKNGKIYPTLENIKQALNNFFQKKNLTALRELTLREVANKVEEGTQANQSEVSGIHERILVCVSGHPDSHRLIRKGYRIADSMNGELTVLYVQLKGQKLQEEYQENIENYRQLTKQLQGEFLEVDSSSIANSIIDIANQKKVTQIVVGESLKESSALQRLVTQPLPYQIFDRTQYIDIHIVARPKKILLN